MTSYGANIHWLETSHAEVSPALSGRLKVDVAIVGGGFTGLWTAYHILRSAPGTRVAVLEAEEIAHGASGRNAGFAMTLLDMSLAHLARNYGDEAATVAHEAVAESVDSIGEFCREHAVDCDYHRGGLMAVATNDSQLARVAKDLETAERLGLGGYTALSAEACRERLDSPTYLGGYHEDACAIVHPARLTHGLKGVVEGLGATIYERTRVRSIEQHGDRVELTTGGGTVVTDQVVVGTNAWSGRIAQFRRKVVPLYTYVLLTEPLTDAQRERIGWRGREGVEDKRNYVHYYRTTDDGRILWGGVDGVIYSDCGIAPKYDGNAGVFSSLEQTFRTTFPQLGDVGFSHRWGGPVGVTVSLTPYFGSLEGGRIHYGFGYAGHGVAPSHMAGRILSSFSLGRRDYAEFPFVNGKEPRYPGARMTWLGAEMTRKSMKKQDLDMDRGKGKGDVDPILVRWLRRMG